MTSVFEPWDEARGAEIIAEHGAQEGATLVILHALQEAFGYVPEAAIPLVAEALNLSRAEVHGVVTFYHDFRQRAGRPPCAEALPRRGLPGAGRRCARGARRSAARRRDRQHHRRWRVTLEPVYCLGLCATARRRRCSMARVVGRLDEARLDALVAEAQR